jgi:hypothetical protein
MHIASLFFSTILTGVPKNNVRFMQDANRRDMDGVLKALKEGKPLMESIEPVKIPRDSAFVLFYAGHGGRVPIPSSWEKAGYRTADGKVEVLVPSDIGKPDEHGKPITGIPDRVIAAVLKGLVHEIGSVHEIGDVDKIVANVVSYENTNI